MNGNLESNRYYAKDIDSNETSIGLPYLDNYSLLFINDFKGIFCYPYPDSLPFIALRYGFGFSPTHSNCMKSEHRKRYCEIRGNFIKELEIGLLHRFEFTYFPYWGNCLLQDSLSLYLNDIADGRTQEIKFFIGNDTPFKYKTISFDFIPLVKTSHFRLHINYNSYVRKINLNQFYDSSIAKRSYVITKDPFSACNYYSSLGFEEEVRMRNDSAFVYYLIRGFNCYSKYDSLKNCKLKTDTILISNIFFKSNSDQANIQSILSRGIDLNGNEILIKGYADVNSDRNSNLKYLSEARAINVRELLKEHFDSEISITPFGGDFPVKSDPYKTLNRRAEVYIIRKSFVNCKDVSN